MTEKTILYNGEVELVFKETGRPRYAVYDMGEKVIPPSVTTICGVLDKSGPLLIWQKNLIKKFLKDAIQPNVAYPFEWLETVIDAAGEAANEVKREAADIGHFAHASLESHFRGLDLQVEVPEPLADRVANCVNAGLGWLAEHKVVPVEVERRIYSRRYGYSGTLDKLAEVDGTLSLIDWKSSKGLYPEYRMQTAAYVQAYEEEMGVKIEKRFLIKLGKEDGEFHPVEFDRSTYEVDFKAFQNALDLYRWLKTAKF